MYHPAQDINHCVYRLILILENSQHTSIKLDTYRMVDFYTLFPYLLKLIKPLPQALSKHRSKFKDIPEPYESLKNTKRILFELEALQSVCIQNLLAKNLLDKESYDSGFLKRSDVALPERLRSEMATSRLSNEEWFKVLVDELPKAVFKGKAGLKARTGLMEYRYDLEKS